jgi:hypothetical protein
MRRFLRLNLSLVSLLALSTGAADLAARNLNEEIAGRLSPAQRQQLQMLDGLSVAGLSEVTEATRAERLRERTAELLALDLPNIGSRSVDASGRSPIHHYIEERIRALEAHGIEFVGSLRSTVAAPTSLDRRLDPALREAPAALALGRETWAVHPLWPNGPMPSLTPMDGLSGPLVYVGRAEWEEIRRIPLEGSIALMEFGGGRNIERLFSLGVQAVVVLEDDFVIYENAAGLMSSTPLPFPRFFIGLEAAGDLPERARASTADLRAGGSGETVRLTGGNVYEPRPIESLFAYLPPTDPVRFEVGPDSLLELIASDFGLTATDLREANQLAHGTPLSEGQRLLIPGGRGQYTVRADDLLNRVAVLYGSSLAEIRQANNLAPGATPAPGTALTLPNREVPLIVSVHIDGASIVPDAPHGARAMANLAGALGLMEHLAASRHLNRRRGILFSFIDGDTLAGAGTRLLGEYLFIQENRLDTAGGSRGITGEQVLARYEAGLPWLIDGTLPATTADARWLAEEWLMGHLEDARIGLAEQRIPIVLALNNATEPEQEARLHAQLERIESELRFVIDLRVNSLALRRASAEERLQALSALLDDPAKQERLARYNLTRSFLRDRYERELEEERTVRINHENNLALGGRLLGLIRGDGGSTPRMGWHLDLLDGSHHLGTPSGPPSDLRLRQAPRAGAFQRRLAPRLRAVAAHAATTAGWEETYTFLSDEDTATLSVIPTRLPPLYDEFWRLANVALMPLGGQNDRLTLIDTPADTLESVNFANLSVQARTAFTVLRLSVESTIDSTVDLNITRPEISRISGATVQFNIRSGIDARDPVPGTYVYLPFTSGDMGGSHENAHMFYGYRRGAVAITLLNGSYRMPIEMENFNRSPRIFAYWLDRDEALFRRVMTQGQVGTQPQTNTFSYRRNGEVERNLVMIDSYPLVIFPGSDPHTYTPIGGNPRSPNRIELIDAVRQGEPRDFAVDNPIMDFRESNLDSAILHLPEGIRVRAMVRRGLNFRMLLVGDVIVDGASAQGRGYRIGPGPDGERNVFLTLTPFRIAEEMTALARHRVEVYRRFGISARSLDQAVERSEEKLAEAREAKEAGEWREAIGSSREGWGILVKSYPRILQLGREAVFSVILLMAFLVPAAYFLQKLLVSAKGIVGQLAWTAGIFTAGTIFLNYFHPAFRVALSPFIVVIAFTMILMSTIVIGLCYGRFEVLLRRFRTSSGEVESEEISFFSSLGTAFSLGVSNLRKRMFRTVLTVLTVTALTFSIIAFVAIRGSDAISRTPVPLDTFLDGDAIEPLSPAYDGILFRNFQWQVFDGARVNALETEFGGTLDLTVRAHFLQVEGGNQAAREGVNQIPVTWNGRTHVLTGIMAFQPNEVDFSGLHHAVSGEQWFRGGSRAEDGSRILAERASVILPDVAAATLGITPEHILDEAGNRRPESELPLVRMSNRDWRVIGILDTGHANRIRDINGRSLAMVDYLRSGFSPAVSGELEQEGESIHMNWTQLAIVPFAARNDVGARLRSVALRFPDDLDDERFFRDVAMRINTPFFAASAGEVSFVVPRQQVDMAGLALVILPVILCILIVMNTMLGTVEERKGEVGMLGAIGLSPRQISFLMFSESTVFSILGIVLGTFGGLFFANVVQGLNARDIEFLSGLSFNFTSLLSMLLATGTGLVVLMATLIPARQAAALAAPSGMATWELPPPEDDGTIRFDLPFTLTRGNAVGMAAFFRQFLINHTESTSEGFNCRDIAFTQEFDETGKPNLILSCDMWLTPYDLDVAQHFRMRLYPGGTEGVFIVRLVLTRFSGSEDNWQRTCYNFLNLVRQQFLFWRNLAPEMRTHFIQQGAQLLKEESRTAETVHA